MIQAQVTYDREARLNITVYGNHGTMLSISAAIDMGFSEYLTLRPDEISALELENKGDTVIMLANGSTERIETYAASVNWDGERLPITVSSSNGTHLLGMRILGGCTITMDVCVDGMVAIEPETCEPFD